MGRGTPRVESEPTVQDALSGVLNPNILFNTKENTKYRGPMPPMATYHLEAMSTFDQTHFRSWYAMQKQQSHRKQAFWQVLLQMDSNAREPVEYEHQKELVAYCTSVLDILRRSCLSFR
jgi:hypothetical protein